MTRTVREDQKALHGSSTSEDPSYRLRFLICMPNILEERHTYKQQDHGTETKINVKYLQALRMKVYEQQTFPGHDITPEG